MAKLKSKSASIESSQEKAPPQFFFGYRNLNGEAVITPRFEQAFEFEGEIARAKIDGKTGVINKQGNWLFEPKFEFLGVAGKSHIAYRDGKLWGIAGFSGALVTSPSYDEILSIGSEVFTARKKDRIQILTFSEDVRVDNIESATRWYNGVASVSTMDGGGIINERGQWLLPPGPRKIYDFCEGLAAFDCEDGSGYYGTDGEIAISPSFEAAYDFSEGLARVRKNGMFGYIDENGDFVIQPTWSDPTQISFSGNTDAMANFSNGFAKSARKVEDRLIAGYLDRAGNWHDADKFESDPRQNSLKSFRAENPAWTEFQEKLELGEPFDEKLRSFETKLEEALAKDAEGASKIITEIMSHSFDGTIKGVKIVVYDSDDFGLMVYPLSNTGEEIYFDDQFWKKNRIAFKTTAKLFAKGVMPEPKSAKGTRLLQSFMLKSTNRCIEWFGELWRQNDSTPKLPVFLQNEDDQRLFDISCNSWIDESDIPLRLRK